MDVSVCSAQWHIKSEYLAQHISEKLQRNYIMVSKQERAKTQDFGAVIRDVTCKKVYLDNRKSAQL